MKAYFLRRLLLVPLTMLGVTFLVFMITRVVPGGPLEQQLQAAQAAAQETGGGSAETNQALDEESIEALEEEFGYDLPDVVAYAQWLGAWPRARLKSKGEFGANGGARIGGDLIDDPETQAVVVLSGTGREVLVTAKKETGDVTTKRWVREEERAKPVRKEQTDEAEVWELVSAKFISDGKVSEEDAADEGWEVRIESPHDRLLRWSARNRRPIEDAPKNYSARAVVYQSKFSGILQGDLGKSRVFGDPVWSLILDRIPVALYFGILTAVITYAVCLPLGVIKAIKHQTWIDHASSVLIFVGYSIPGFALGGILLVYLGARTGWFPMIGLDSPELSDLDWWHPERIKDRLHHTVLPLICYVIGSFAWMTMMMKNNLMDNLAADYVRTAVAKGAGWKRAVFKHAFRNSFIPIATTLGQLITMLVGGSMLIEKVFDIQGFGLLQFQALTSKDYPVVMGTLTIAAFLLVIGNIISDFIVALIDPRVKFQ